MFNFSKLDSIILAKISETRLPGVSIAAVKGGKVVYARGYGLREVTCGKPTTPDTLYCIGSITKSFTCIAIMQLQERGLLSVEDAVEKHLPIRLRAKGKQVKVSHLMSHSSGIPATAYAEAVIQNTMNATNTYLPLATSQDLHTFLDDSEAWAHNPPGERWFYFNEGFRLLGEIIEKLSGESYTDYVKAHILDPLGMRRSTFSPDAVAADPDAATPYIIDREGKQIPSTYPYGIIGSDGGLISSANEMAEYLKMLLNNGKAGRKHVLSPESLAEMTKPRIRTPDQPWITKRLRHYCYGLGTLTEPGAATIITHGGSVSTATAQIAYAPEEGTGVIVLANGSGYPLATIAEYALAALAGRDPDQLPTIRFENTLKSLEGNYETYKHTTKARVTRRGSILTFDTTDKHHDASIPAIPLDWESPTKTFEVPAGDRKYIAEFYKQDGEQYLIYERYKYKRV